MAASVETRVVRAEVPPSALTATAEVRHCHQRGLGERVNGYRRR
jgi:hypothetical protein